MLLEVSVMSKTNQTNFSLLDQQEIDALVKFLTEKKSDFLSDVMSQNHIDKLISLIQTDKERIILDLSEPLGSLDERLLKKLHLRNNLDEICELTCKLDEESGFIKLYVTNLATNETSELTPKTLDSNDTEEWGRAISPFLFNNIAITLSLKYTRETHDQICSIYAQRNFGDAEHKIPEFYLPDNASLLECLL